MKPPDKQPDGPEHSSTESYKSTDANPRPPKPSSQPPQGPPLWIPFGAIVVLLAGAGIGLWVAPWARSATQSQVKQAVDQVDRALSEDMIDQSTRDTVVKALKDLAAKPEVKADYYTCGMHPWVILPKPGDCPICRMKLTPIDPAKFTGEVSINPVVVQNMGVRIEPVTQGPLVKTIRTVGTVDYDEQTVRDINIKVSGWIENLRVDFVGAAVEKDQPLFDLYSPQLYAAQEEYLLAWRGRDRLGDTAVSPQAAANAQALLDAARTKLQYFDITDAQIAELQRRGAPAKAMTIRSPYPGVVIAKHANEGMKVDPGMQVFRIADLSKVWVMVTLYEYQLPYVAIGQEAVMTLPYIPGQTFTGKVIYIYPYLDRKVRQVNVRLEFDNPTGLLKPGMYANVELRNELAAQRTLAPRSAVIDTGERQVAFVSLGEGRFEPREVQLGVESENGMVEVIDGLKAGEMVVTSGQFLLDSEANIRESLARMIKGTPAAEQQAVAKVEGESELASLPDELAADLNQLLAAYLRIGDTLADDRFEGIAEDARAIAEKADHMTGLAIPDHPHFWHRHEEVARLGGAALQLAQAKDLASARGAFADVSIALGMLLKATGVPPTFDKPLQQLHCPMYRSGQGGNVWLQTGDQVRNPFFGSRMLECFDQRRTLPVTGQKLRAAEPAPVKTPALPSPSALPPAHQH